MGEDANDDMNNLFLEYLSKTADILDFIIDGVGVNSGSSLLAEYAINNRLFSLLIVISLAVVWLLSEIIDTAPCSVCIVILRESQNGVLILQNWTEKLEIFTVSSFSILINSLLRDTLFLLNILSSIMLV